MRSLPFGIEPKLLIYAALWLPIVANYFKWNVWIGVVGAGIATWLYSEEEVKRPVSSYSHHSQTNTPPIDRPTASPAEEWHFVDKEGRMVPVLMVPPPSSKK